MKLQFAVLCIATSIIYGLVDALSETAKSDVPLTSTVIGGSGSSSLPASSASSSAIASGPEARQVPSAISAGSNSPVYPYNLYQNSLYSGYDGSSSGPSTSSMLSFLRSPQGGRRSSLTNRLRNLMNAIFFRESSSPYMASGSNNFYSLRQPAPFSFSSSIPSGYSPSSSANFLNAAASAYRPVVFPNYPGSSSASSSSGGSGNSMWSNYKQWASGSSSAPSGSQLASSLGSPGGANYAWISSSSLGSSNPNSMLSSLSGSPSAGSVPYSSPGSGGFQVAASNTYSSSYPSSSASSYSPSNTPYQRSSNSNFKPVSSSAISSSSSSSSGNPSATSFKQ